MATPAVALVESPVLNWERFSQAMKEAAQTSALVFFILIGAMIFARFLVLTGCLLDCPVNALMSSIKPTYPRCSS